MKAPREFGECLERALAIFPTSLTLNSHSFPFLLRFPYELLERAILPSLTHFSSYVTIGYIAYT